MLLWCGLGGGEPGKRAASRTGRLASGGWE
jgi:hypothetical protein